MTVMSPFADLESRVNASVLAHLANARVRIGEGGEIPGIFKRPSSTAGGGVGMDDTRPTVSVSSGAVPAEPEGQPVLVDDVAYLVARALPDGTGMTLLILEDA